LSSPGAPFTRRHDLPPIDMAFGTRPIGETGPDRAFVLTCTDLAVSLIATLFAVGRNSARRSFSADLSLSL